MRTEIVTDVKVHFSNAKRQGETIWAELHETVSGERQYGAMDLQGTCPNGMENK